MESVLNWPWRGSGAGAKATQADRKQDRALLCALILAALSVILSSTVLAWPRPNNLPATDGILPRPNPYIGLERVSSLRNISFPPLYTYPRAIFQIDNNDPSRALREDDRQWMTKFGGVVPEDYHLLATSTESSVVQFRSADWGFEKCVLHLSLPITVSAGRFASSVTIWRLADDEELIPHISWGTAPRRRDLVASRGNNASRIFEFACPSGSFPTFEFGCSVDDPECAVDFWQDEARSAHAAVYIVQYWSMG